MSLCEVQLTSKKTFGLFLVFDSVEKENRMVKGCCKILLGDF